MLIIISIAATSCSKKDELPTSNNREGSDAKWPVLNGLTKVGMTASSITVKISVASTGNYPLVKYGVYVGVEDTPLIAGAAASGGVSVVLISATANDFTVEIKGLTANYPYLITAWASNKYQASQKNMSPASVFRTASQ